MRRGVLVLAGSVPAEVYVKVADRLSQDGPLRVVRAVADWTRPEVSGWLPVLRTHGISMRHHFRTRDSHDPAIAALTVEALTLVATGDLDHLVLVGDVGAATPLVVRLRELGISVTGIGPTRTPHDFRLACDEFWDLAEFCDSAADRAAGRHRAAAPPPTPD